MTENLQGKCLTCKFLKDDLKFHHKNYVRCSWEPTELLPLTLIPFMMKGVLFGSASWLTREVVYKEQCSRMLPCPAWIEETLENQP